MSTDNAQRSSGQWLGLGRLGAPHGIRGWVKLHSYTQPKENIQDYRYFLTRPAEDGQVAETKLDIDQIKPHGKGLIAHVKGYDDPEKSRALTGLEIGVDGSELPALDSDEYYWHELQGLQVINASGQLLGRVTTLLETGANDVLVVDPIAGSIDDRQRLIPWLPEQVVTDVDRQAGILRVDWESDWLQD